MIKNTISLSREKQIEWQMFPQILMGALYGICADERILVFVILYLFHIYSKGKGSYIIFTTILTLTAFIVSFENGLLYLMACTIFAFIAMVYERMHWPLIKHLFLYNTLITFLVGFLLYQSSVVTYSLCAMSLVLGYSYGYLLKENLETKKWVFVFISTIYLLLLPLFPAYNIYLQLGYITLCAYLLPMNLSIFVLLYFTILGLDPLYAIYLLLIAYNRTQRMFLSLFSWIGVVLSFELYNVFFATICSILGMLSYEQDDTFMQSSMLIEKEHRLYMEHSFYRQIVNYAGVFYNLAKYYGDRNEELSEMLERMGEAMEQNARLSKQYFYKRTSIQNRIEETLNGYHFSVKECKVQEEKDHMLIHLEIDNLFEGEMEEVILPLLEKLCENSLRIALFTPYPLQKGKYSVVIESSTYATVSTYGNSVHVHEVSGDSYHFFEVEESVVLMLSDGMGQGIKAQRTSSILIQIMEALLRCQIPQRECIKMMNLFLRSDMYATLDVLTIDRRSQKAFLSKAASAPTYLLRQGELYEMNAHSLPIGIVDHIQADVYEIPFEKGDVFIMCSDGVEKNEIEKWQNLRRCTMVKNEGLNLLNIIKEKKRIDDSTIVMAKIE